MVATFAANVVRARQDMGLSQRQLAIKLGVDTLAVSRWETARVMPTTKNLVALAVALGKDPAWFYAEHDADESRSAA